MTNGIVLTCNRMHNIASEQAYNLTLRREFPTVVAKLHEIGSKIKSNSRSKALAEAAAAAAVAKGGGYAGLGYAGLSRLLPTATVASSEE